MDRRMIMRQEAAIYDEGLGRSFRKDASQVRHVTHTVSARCDEER
jgi:hypothetical protein